MTEYRVYGPPGTGKTFNLCNKIIPEVSREYGADKIMVTSFTRTAALNIARRAGLDTSDPKCGTLHSICYAAQKRPKLVDTVLKEWNSQNPKFNIKTSSDIKTIPTNGSKTFYDYFHYLRNKKISIESWPTDLKKFNKKWTEFKFKTGTIDFTDMIEIALHEFPSPPFGTSVIIVDEAQDLTPLQISLIRSWGITIPKVFLCLDDDQSIYSFNGVDIEEILLPDVSSEQKIFLGQSYRVPQKPHKIANKIVRRIKTREEKQYLPTEKIGSVHRGSACIDQPKLVMKEVENTSGSVMIMASCGYMLQNITQYMRDEGIPFYNPYKENRKWNPLDTQITEGLYAFLSTGEDAEFWDTRQFLTWTEHIKTSSKDAPGIIKKQGTQLIKRLKEELSKSTPGLHTCREYIGQILHPDAIPLALNRDLDWLKSVLKTKQKNSILYPLKVYQRNWRKEDLIEDPRIIIGTIHSFKGTEADNVFIFPDISYSAHRERMSAEGEDNINRLMYVGVTRTKDKLFLMQPSTDKYYKFPRIE